MPFPLVSELTASSRGATFVVVVEEPGHESHGEHGCSGISSTTTVIDSRYGF